MLESNETAGGVISTPARHTEGWSMYSQEVCDRFWSKVNKDGPVPPHMPHLGKCWVWTAGRFSFGYGQFWSSPALGIPPHAHRISWQLANGEQPRGMCVLHACDNPPCVNPAHLFLGTKVQNATDRHAKGRTATGDRSGSRKHPDRVARGSRVALAKLTEASVVEMRRIHAEGLFGHRELAAMFGVSKSNVNKIVSGVTWRHA